MADHAESGPPELPSTTEPVIEAYETDGTIVLYDSTNPMAWIESTISIPIEDVP